MKRLGLVAVLSLLTACGGSESDPADPALNPAMSGVWSGNSTVAFTGGDTFAGSAYMVIAVTGNNASIANVCPDNSGTVQATGSGDTAGWSGNLVCPPVSFNTCGAVTFSYQHATLTLSNGVITLVATGSGSGCGTTYPTTVTAALVKQ